MNQILALREKRANLWNQTKAFLDSHRGEDGIAWANGSTLAAIHGIDRIRRID
ncbi:MAG: hypothetical protein J6A79_08155 [Clostridia bacterium]|nr:hypothetical protein [Clostridia bacterium]MBO6164389.1 hypothetical protein [Lachnospiraceae bacterium]